jgi:hypothetical protein
VREDTARRVRVVHEERQRARLLGDARPAKRGRDILTVAGEVLRDRLRVLERVALEGELAHHHICAEAGRARNRLATVWLNKELEEASPDLLRAMARTWRRR